MVHVPPRKLPTENMPHYLQCASGLVQYDLGAPVEVRLDFKKNSFKNKKNIIKHFYDLNLKCSYSDVLECSPLMGFIDTDIPLKFPKKSYKTKTHTLQMPKFIEMPYTF